MAKRRLIETEQAEAQLVFHASLDFDRVRVVEGAQWPNLLARLGGFLQRAPVPQVHNAVTLFDTAYFPRALKTRPADLSGGDIGDLAWLVHELTHVWQNQHYGPTYLLKALQAQLQLGSGAYDYGGEAGLIAARQAGRKLRHFNMEQQGDIARDYYVRLKFGQDTAAWEPFVAELRAG
jgi:hypothetical protein